MLCSSHFNAIIRRQSQVVCSREIYRSCITSMTFRTAFDGSRSTTKCTHVRNKGVFKPRSGKISIMTLIHHDPNQSSPSSITTLIYHEPHLSHTSSLPVLLPQAQTIRNVRPATSPVSRKSHCPSYVHYCFCRDKD
jgi:hypothetical protein